MVLFALLCFGCGTPPVAVLERSVDETGWSSADTVLFEFNITEPGHRHDVQFGLRHNSSYPFSNLYFFLTLHYPNGRVLHDTLECPLAAPDGTWYGEGRNWIDHRIGYKEGVQFPLSGDYSLSVVQAMRRDPVPGIAAVRLMVRDRESL